MRCATGNRVIYRQGALRRVLRALQAKRIVSVPIDQRIPDANAVMVDFFDRPAATTSALAMLALRTGAPLVPAFAMPLSGGRYRVIYEYPVELPAAGAGDPVRELTQRCSDVLEMYVRRHPQLWLWMHRRWRDLEGQPTVPGMFPAAASDERRVDRIVDTGSTSRRIVVRPPNWLGTQCLRCPRLQPCAATSRQRISPWPRRRLSPRSSVKRPTRPPIASLSCL
jgi:hypothetical protein